MNYYNEAIKPDLALKDKIQAGLRKAKNDISEYIKAFDIEDSMDNYRVLYSKYKDGNTNWEAVYVVKPGTDVRFINRLNCLYQDGKLCIDTMDRFVQKWEYQDYNQQYYYDWKTIPVQPFKYYGKDIITELRSIDPDLLDGLDIK